MMTWALCFACGNVKFGAICPCDRCQVTSSGDMTLDINFSDHYLARTTLEQLGKVIETINLATDNKQLGFYSFIYYVSENHPSLLKYTPPPSEREQIRNLFANLTLPPVELLTPNGRPFSAKGAPDESDDSSSSTTRKRWWQFWRRGP